MELRKLVQSGFPHQLYLARIERVVDNFFLLVNIRNVAKSKMKNDTCIICNASPSLTFFWDIFVIMCWTLKEEYSFTIHTNAKIMSMSWGKLPGIRRKIHVFHVQTRLRTWPTVALFALKTFTVASEASYAPISLAFS